MTDGTRALLGVIAACLTVLGSVALLADCSKTVSAHSTDAIEACVKNGGHWAGSNDGVMSGIDGCYYPPKAPAK